MTEIYMDHAATTPMHPDVIEAMRPYMQAHFGNPSSIHQFGRQSRAALDEARRTLSEFIGAKTNELIFTSSGTEADNLALFGVALANQDRGKHIITSQVEHHAVMHACEQLEEAGFEVTYLPVDQQGRLSVESVEQAIRKDTILVTLLYGNNEIGTLQPIAEIGQLLQEKEIYFHTDAVQAFGLERFDVNEIGVNLLSVSGHKINGPKGIGFLYVDSSVKLKPLLYGGAQERNRRAGTENLPGIVGLARAAELAYENLEQKRTELHQLRLRLLEHFEAADLKYTLNGHAEYTLPHILNVSFLGVKADAMLMNLDLEGIAASSGSACSAGSLKPSHVIEAMTDDVSRVESAIRFSFGYGNTLKQIDSVASKVIDIIHRLKNIERG